MSSNVLVEEALKQADDEQRISLIERQIKATVDHICDHYKKDHGVGNRSKIFERLFNKKKNSRLRAQFLEQEGEAFVEQNFVWPLLSILDYEYKIEINLGPGIRKTPDFLITNTSPHILGEVKNLGRHEEAKEDMKEYLSISDYDYGIITDGLYWVFLRYSSNGENKLPNSITAGELRGIVANHVSKNNYVEDSIINNISNISTMSAEEFYMEFNREAIIEAQRE